MLWDGGGGDLGGGEACSLLRREMRIGKRNEGSSFYRGEKEMDPDGWDWGG